MVADGTSIVMSIVTVDERDTAFVVDRTRIGSNSFLDDRILCTADSRVGDAPLIGRDAFPTTGEDVPPGALCRTESSHDDRHSRRPHHLDHP